MITKLKKVIIAFLCIFLTISCGSYHNRFHKNNVTQFLTLGIYPSKDECEKITSVGLDGQNYKNGVRRSRTCVNYNRYLCRIDKVCNGDKQCEFEAAQYWLKEWRDVKTKRILDRATATKEICESEKIKCDSAPKEDQTCRK